MALLSKTLSHLQISICNGTKVPNNATCKVDYISALAYTPLFLLGLCLNVAALRIFIARRASWKDTHVYMFNLNMADFALILFLPFRICDALFCLPRTNLCTYLMFIHFINMYASILTTMAISVHRFLAIRFPLQARSWRKKKETAFAVCLILWVLLVTSCAIFREENRPDKLWNCFERCKNRPLKLVVILILTCLGFLTPLLIIVYCSHQIISILLKEGNMSEEKMNTIGIVKANMAVFIFCYTPIHIGFIVNYYYIFPPDWQEVLSPVHIYLLVSEWIASTNCCFDSISYYFLLRRFYSDAMKRVALRFQLKS